MKKINFKLTVLQAVLAMVFMFAACKPTGGNPPPEPEGEIPYYQGYSITFNANGGKFEDGEEEITLTSDTPRIVGADMPTAPAIDDENLNFGGFYTSVEGGDRVTASTQFGLADKNFTVYARWLDQLEMEVAEAWEKLAIETYLDYHYFEIPLPSSGANGTAIAWASSNPTYAPSGGRIKITDNNEFTGNITLTATISKDEISDTKEFTVEVVDKKFAAYLMAYFTGNAQYQEQLRYALSPDGRTFTALNGNQPVKTFFDVSESGGIRDPFIVRGKNGKFYMIMTDMVSAKGWTSNRGFVLLKSDDLVTWEHSLVNIRNKYPTFNNITRAWAPELVYDRAKGKYFTVFALDPPGGDSAKNKLYYTWVNDEWTDLMDTPQVLFNNDDVDVIDGSIYYLRGKYHMFFKNSGRVAKVESSSLYGPWTNKITPIGENVQSEGPQTFRYIGSDTIVFFYDKDATDYFGYRETTDMVNFTTPANMTTIQANGDRFVARHGVVIPLTQAEYDRLKNYSWPASSLPPVTTDATLKLHYTFSSTDTTGSGGIKNQAPGYAGQYDGTIAGTGGSSGLVTTNGIRNFYTGTNTGTASSGTMPAYIDMGASASQIVTGQTDFTVAAYVYYNSATAPTGDGWFLWCMANTTAGASTGSRYTFFKGANGRRQSFTVNGYSNESNVSLGDNIPTQRWTHVMYRQKDNMGVIFIDGKVASAGITTIATTSLPPGSGTGLIYNWIGRPCFTGDNLMPRTRYADFRIYSGAISDSQIAALNIEATLAEMNK